MNREAVRRSEPRGLPLGALGSVPRDVRLTRQGIAVAATGVVLAVAAIVIAITLTVLYVRTQRERDLRAHEALRTDAVVLQVEMRNGERPRRVVTYRYQAADRSYTDRATLRRSDSRGASRGDSIGIAYVASRPAMSWVPGYEPSGMPFAAIPLAALALLATAVLCGWPLRRQWLLLSEGRAAEARVTALKKVQSDKHRAYRVTYEFRTISGAKQTSHYEVGKNPPPIGSVVPIVYHRERPEWTALYPLGLVRPGHRE